MTPSSPPCRQNPSLRRHDRATKRPSWQALQDGNRGVVAVFGPAAGRERRGLPAVTLYYNVTEGPISQVAVGAVRQTLIDVAGGPPPLPIEERPVTAQDVSFMDVFAPGILAMSLMNSGVIGLATAFVTYRERGILRRIRVTPVPAHLLHPGAGDLAALIVAALQAVILIGMAWALFGLHLRGNPLVLLLAIVAGALAFLAIGFAISGIAPNAETAASYANLITFPMLFLSGIFFSMENAPAWLRPITNVLPLAYLVDALREPMTLGNGLSAIWLDLRRAAAHLCHRHGHRGALLPLGRAPDVTLATGYSAVGYWLSVTSREP